MSLIVPESIDIASLPSLVLAERKQLPNCAASFVKKGNELQRDETKVV